MSKQEVLIFMMTYQRITESMFKYASKYASVLMNLNDRHLIKKIKFLKNEKIFSTFFIFINN